MGGNSSYNKTLNRVRGKKRTHQEYHDRVDGHKILLQNKCKTQVKVPMNSNSESPLYLCARKTKQGGIEIASVGIYQKHKCVGQIDLSFDKEGNLIPFSNGKGSHYHNFSTSKTDKQGRNRHDKLNTLPIDPKYNQLIQHIEEYNKNHKAKK